MCGRYVTTRRAAELSTLFEAVDETTGLAPRYNAAPTQPLPVVRFSRRRDGRVLSTARWGLLPPWARDPRAGSRMINARSETVATSRAYARPFARRRALVPMDGWYEWRRLPDGGKQPYFITPADGSVLALAGLWSRWGPEQLLTFTILTTAAVGGLAEIHDRMPLPLPPAEWDEWLVGDPPPLAPPSAELVASLAVRPVGPAVGNVRNDDPSLVKSIDCEPVTTTPTSPRPPAPADQPPLPLFPD